MTAVPPGRGTGKTTRQMQAAKYGALFVWGHRDLWYPKTLARYLGRLDLDIRCTDWVKGGRWRGLQVPQMVIDHAVPDFVWEKMTTSLMGWKLLDTPVER